MRLTDVLACELWCRRPTWKNGYAVKYVRGKAALVSTDGNPYMLSINDYLARDWELFNSEPNVEQPGDPFDLYAPRPSAAPTKPVQAPPAHDIAWAMQSLRDGLPVRREAWPPHVNLYCRADEDAWVYFRDMLVSRWRPEQEDLWADDWEVDGV